MKDKQKILSIIKEIKKQNGQAYVVGGYVRDQLLGLNSKDLDIEVYQLSYDQLHTILKTFGEVQTIGKAFGTFYLKGVDADFSLPRTENKVGLGHKGFEVYSDPFMNPIDACRRRDFTINAMMMDLETGELFDHFEGRQDLNNKILRATDPEKFVEDPLRVLRLAQFAARLDFSVDLETIELCKTLDLSELPKERLFTEFEKLLLKARKPSTGLQVLKQTDMLRFFPELKALVNCPQDPKFHPEGDVFEHTCMVVDALVELYHLIGKQRELHIMFAALIHDMGKPATTVVHPDKRITSERHDTLGVKPAMRFMDRLTDDKDLLKPLPELVKCHMIPLHWSKQKTKVSDKAIRRLAERVKIEDLVKLTRADHKGRLGATWEYPFADYLIERARELKADRGKVTPVVMGRHLVDRGLKPGPHFGTLIYYAYEQQLETGIDQVDTLIDLAVNRYEAENACIKQWGDSVKLVLEISAARFERLRQRASKAGKSIDQFLKDVCEDF